MSVYHNETFGDLTAAEHEKLRQGAHTCTTCGMLADVDPLAHARRYRHGPTYRADGKTWTFSRETLTWTEKTGG